VRHVPTDKEVELVDYREECHRNRRVLVAVSADLVEPRTDGRIRRREENRHSLKNVNWKYANNE
jgi:hypothetical protein